MYLSSHQLLHFILFVFSFGDKFHYLILAGISKFLSIFSGLQILAIN